MSSEAEESTWKLVKDSNSAEDLRYFLEKFPDSPYAIPAKLKLKQLEKFDLLSPSKNAYLFLQSEPYIVLFYQTICSGSLQRNGKLGRVTVAEITLEKSGAVPIHPNMIEFSKLRNCLQKIYLLQKVPDYLYSLRLFYDLPAIYFQPGFGAKQNVSCRKDPFL